MKWNGMDISGIHHVSLTVRDLDRSRRFYNEVLGLREIERPPFSFPGAWFAAGAGQHLHLIVHTDPTFRGDKGIDTRDVHFAVRVSSFSKALELLRAKGFREDAGDRDPHVIRVSPRPVAGFPQMYIMDPDRHVIEINAEALD
jgi:glyoxylase I family protein